MLLLIDVSTLISLIHALPVYFLFPPVASFHVLVFFLILIDRLYKKKCYEALYLLASIGDGFLFIPKHTNLWYTRDTN